MINLPIFNRLDVNGYGLFPGLKDEPGLHVSFLPGLTFVLGANGLGKTTFVTMLYRMLTGPFDISALMAGNFRLGTPSLEATSITQSQKETFSQRVVDSAREAYTCLDIKLGNHPMVIERRLKDLRLVNFKIDEIEQPLDEKLFQKKICELVGVWSFGDWILLLRHIIFYFENRRSLVWDPTAQRQLLRILFLPPERAQSWTEAERDIVELDSRMRNLRNALNKEIKRVRADEIKVKGAENVRAEMELLDKSQQDDNKRLEELDNGVTDLESRRKNARLKLLKAQQERETRYRELERAKLMAIEARFPDNTESARYILAQLLTSSRCLFCGNQVPDVVTQLESRISAHQCVICGSNLKKMPEDANRANTADNQVSTYIAALEAIEPELAEAKRALDEVEDEYSTYILERTKLDADIAQRAARLEELSYLLPPGDAVLLRQRTQLDTLHGRVEEMKAELETKRSAFKEFMLAENRSLAEQSQGIQTSFNRYAKGFLFDDCVLTWAPYSQTLGEGGETMEFPAFEIDLSGTNFPSPVRRNGPEQVSESQREFIDLAFRMALMEIAASNSIGSLVIDAPESSLDAVFSKRAAQVLALFAKPEKRNRLIVTSNLIEGSLISDLVGQTTNQDDRGDRIVNLFELAEPTRATKEMRTEYDDEYNDMMIRADSNSKGEFGLK